MGEPTNPSPALLLLAVSSRHSEAFDFSRSAAEAAFGPVALASEPFEFVETDYYRTTMGDNLRKGFLVFERLIEPAQLPGIKLTTNRWEADYAQMANHAEPRPLNLDPGYLTTGKLVLASTKDHSHRLYLADGIYAEVTLYFKDRRWQHREWTYPDYRRSDYQAFLTESRDYLRRRLREGQTA